MNSRLPLDGRWELFYVDHQSYLKYSGAVNTAAALGCSGFDNIPAQVPGNLALDLQNAGKLPDPFMGDNTLLLQNLECLHAFYCRTFKYSDIGECVYLTFEGLDDIADIYLNGDKIGSSANMLIPHSFGPLSLNDGINELVVHIKPDVIEARAYDIPVSASAMKYNWDGLYTRKAPSMYGWDIMPRALSGGIWRSVYIESRKDEYISDIFVRTLSVDEGSMTARLAVDYTVSSEFNSLRGVKLTLRGICGDAEFYTEQTLWHTSSRFEFTVGDAKLWMPHNYGVANLYDVTASLIRDGAVTDLYTLRFGIRTVELDRTSITDDAGSGEFCFRVNGHKIFAMGSNWVPVDAFHSRDAQRLPTLLPMLGDLGCNIVRCWGGNVYENDIFFAYCDAHGIMVWQDFAMACAAYPQDNRFRAMLEPEIISVVKRLRSRACLILWAGDNECDYFYADPQKNAITREWIPGWLSLYDNSRPYLPSSPYRDATAVASGCVTPEDHLWGPRDYFKGDYYRNAPAHFASETGYHGCPAPESLTRFIPEDKLWPWDNDDWRVHSASPERAKDAPYAYRNGLMASQVRTLFGYEPDNLEEFSRASQISQAEAKKYFIERFRVSKWRRTGIIWWNLVDGWPQISDAIVDYYGVRKLAYQYIKRSQQPVCLIFGEPENGLMTLYGVNDTQRDIELDYIVTELDSGVCCHSDKALLPQNTSVKLWEMPYTSHMQKFIFIQWQGDAEGVNHHMTGMPGLNLERYVELAKKAGFEL
jgi:Beta-galactosidase/beta-glucuronidase